MKLEVYKKYARVYDFFNDGPFMSGRILTLLKRLVETVPENGRITDLGGGTAFFTAKLLTVRPDIRLTFIEPAPEMFEIAAARLPRDCSLHCKTVDQALDSLESQDAFLLMRVLYALYDNTGDYERFFKRLHCLLNPGGYLFILDIDRIYSMAEVEEFYTARVTPEIEAEFNEKWPLFKEMQTDFNRSVAEGIYTVLADEELDKLATAAGFQRMSSRKRTFIYRKS